MSTPPPLTLPTRTPKKHQNVRLALAPVPGHHQTHQTSSATMILPGGNTDNGAGGCSSDFHTLLDLPAVSGPGNRTKPHPLYPSTLCTHLLYLWLRSNKENDKQMHMEVVMLQLFIQKCCSADGVLEGGAAAVMDLSWSSRACWDWLAAEWCGDKDTKPCPETPQGDQT
ncbi:hypothetical protein AALO_G00055740 [Alosa alosa]|uniref:Uncharacterized protein n=1 Tax=Alosa alosa TaxID=278164 RepID=A0AAV6H566_9TELE|nr:hypothetical protein AALO_G00055740 [Alosa alosa]